jgi:hypothetical protein
MKKSPGKLVYCENFMPPCLKGSQNRVCPWDTLWAKLSPKISMSHEFLILVICMGHTEKPKASL